MLIRMSREEIIANLQSYMDKQYGLVGILDIGFEDNELTAVMAVGENLPDDLFDTDSEEEPSVIESAPKSDDKAPAKPVKRTRRTRAQIEADEAKQKAEEAKPVTPTEDDSKPPFDTDPVAPAAAEVAAQEETAKPVEEEPNPFAEAEATPKQESDEEADPANEDNPFADAGATSDPFASSSEPASDTNFFSVDGNTSEEFNKPAEDNQDVFKLFD